MRFGFPALVLCGLCAIPARSGEAEALSQRQLIGVLVQSLDDADGEVRQNIAIALANLGEVALPALVEALTNQSAERRMGAAMAIGQIRPAAKSAVPALVKAMKDSNEGVRRQASYSLSRMVQPEPLVFVPYSARPKIPPVDPIPGGTP